MANITPLTIDVLTLGGRNLTQELWDGFGQIVIYEDIFRNSMSGYIDIGESINMREAMPIIGEEYFVVRFNSMASVSKTPDDPILFVMKVFKLTNFTEGNLEQRMYRLHLQSLQAETNRTKRIRKVYEGKGSSIVSRILDGMFGGAELKTVDATKYEEKYVFPNWYPYKCIDFIARTSISAQYNDPYYLFYEDRDGFHFQSLSKMFDQDKAATIEYKIIDSKSDEDQDKYLATKFNFSPMFDVLENELNGMYGGRLVTYDKVLKKRTETDLTYTETFGKFKHLGPTKLTNMKVEAPENHVQFMMTNDTKSPGLYDHVDEWATQRRIRSAQARGLRAIVELNRATNLKLADVVQFDFLNSKGKKDKLLSGKWVLSRMKHVITPVGYTCQVEMIKDGYAT